MSSIDPAVPSIPFALIDPKPPTNWRRLIVDHNPFFMLSALCMLGGSVAVTNSLSWSPVRLERILMLTATINVYELIVVALAAALLRRPACRRDGSILLILEAFFLVDVAFLNAELFAIDRWVGLAANVVLFSLAIAKIAYIGPAIGLRLTRRELAVPLGTILTIYALPGVLKFYAIHHGGTLPALAMLATWWAIFAIGVGLHHALLHRQDAQRRGVADWFAPLLSVLSGISLLAHAGTSQWIYDLHFWGADLAPVLALATFILCSHRETRTAGVLSAVAALFASGSFGRDLRMSIFDEPLTPIHLTIAVVYLVLAFTLARQLFAYFVGFGFLAALIAIFGPSIATIRQAFAYLLEDLEAAIEFARPKTLTHWGILSIVSSFALLAIGAVVSLRRQVEELDSASGAEHPT